MKKPNKNFNSCFNCDHFFITHDKYRRWGCKNFGFKSKMIPAVEVFASTGMKCAYKVEKKYAKKSNNQKMSVRRI